MPINVRCLLTLLILTLTTSPKPPLPPLLTTIDQVQQKYSKKYRSEQEKTYRKSILQSNKKIINEHNKKTNRKYDMGENGFIDLTSEEFVRVYTGLIQSTPPMRQFVVDTGDLAVLEQDCGCGVGYEGKKLELMKKVNKNKLEYNKGIEKYTAKNKQIDSQLNYSILPKNRPSTPSSPSSTSVPTPTLTTAGPAGSTASATSTISSTSTGSIGSAPGPAGPAGSTTGSTSTILSSPTVRSPYLSSPVIPSPISLPLASALMPAVQALAPTNILKAALLLSSTLLGNQTASTTTTATTTTTTTPTPTPTSTTTFPSSPTSTTTLPDIDWTNMSGSIRYQGLCGACWAFTTVNVLEASNALYLFGGVYIQLSVQQVLDCAMVGFNGCEGGLLEWSYNMMRIYGVTASFRYPYTSGTTGTVNACKSQTGQFKIISYKQLNGTCLHLRQQLQLKPVSTAIKAKNMQFYASGVYEGCLQTDPFDHAVVIIGFNSTQGWKFKNTWGTAWGMEGYGWLSLEESKNCGICVMPVVPRTYNQP